MSDTEKKVLETLSEVLPKLSEPEKRYLLGWGEGATAAVKKQQGEVKSRDDEGR